MAKEPNDPMLERSVKLPDEILQAQQSRSDLLKWKLVIAATLGAAGFGLSEKVDPAPLLLTLIPFSCLYVDLLCHNLSIRQIMIGTFYAKQRGDDYERFVARNRGALCMEDWALWGSTLTVCILLLFVGVGLRLDQTPPTPAEVRPWFRHGTQGLILIIAALLGLVLSWIMHWRRNRLCSKIVE